MFFQSWSEFIDMGGYGFYVWLSYGITVLAIGGLLFENYFRRRNLLKVLHRRTERELRQQN